MPVENKHLTVNAKCEILKKIEDGIAVKKICEEYKINKSTASRIKQNKIKIEKFASESFVSTKKITKIGKILVPLTEKSLYEWFLNQRLMNNIVTNEGLKAKAKEFHSKLEPQINFSISNGWINNFKKRHGIRLLTICGEKLSSNDSAIPEFIEKFKQTVKDLDLLPEQVYNADETGLVYKCLNNKTLVGVSETNAPGKKKSKERLTIMPCVNATGTHKLPLMVIGKAKNPRAFQNVTLPQMHYKSSKNSWQSQLLFKEWFFTQFIPQVRHHLLTKCLPQKAILLLDNATCHCEAEVLKSDDGNISVMFFPANTTAILQPLDQQIILSLKQRYRKKLMFSLLAADGDNMYEKLKSVNIKDVVFMVTEAWSEILKETVINGFKHIFPCADYLTFNLRSDHFDDDDDVPLAQLYRQLLPDTLLICDEIMDWAGGRGENHHSLITDVDILENAGENKNNDETGSNRIHDINQVIKSLNYSIDWAEESLSVEEILFLRKIREKAVVESIKQNRSK